MYSAKFVYADFRRSGDSASVYFRSRIRVKLMTSLNDHHFCFVHNRVVGDKLLNFHKTCGHTCLG